MIEPASGGCVLTDADITSIADHVTSHAPRAMHIPNGSVAALIAMLREAQGAEQRVRDRFAHIRTTMLMGLEDAELYGEPGRERIEEWADWVEGEVLAALHGVDTAEREGDDDD